MKFVLMAFISAITLSGFSAHAFITSAEQTRVLATLNDGSFGHQVQFEDIRCSLRSRMCIVKMELAPRALKAGCMIERITGSADILTESVVNGQIHTELSPYAQGTIANCIEQLSR